MGDNGRGKEETPMAEKNKKDDGLDVCFSVFSADGGEEWN